MQSAEQSSEREERSGVRPNIRPVYEDGVFGQIKKLTHGFRTGLMLVLGAVAGAGTGASCAHLSPEQRSAQACEDINQKAKNEIRELISNLLWNGKEIDKRPSLSKDCQERLRFFQTMLIKKVEVCQDVEVKLRGYEGLGVIAEICDNDDIMASIYFEKGLALAARHQFKKRPPVLNKIQRSLMRISERTPMCNERKDPLVFAEKCNNDFEKIGMYVGLGTHSRQHDKPLQAEKYFLRAVELLNELKEKLGIEKNLDNFNWDSDDSFYYDPKHYSDAVNITPYRAQVERDQAWYGHHGSEAEYWYKRLAKENFDAKKEFEQRRKNFFSEFSSDETTGKFVRNIEAAKQHYKNGDYFEAMECYDRADYFWRALKYRYEPQGLEIPQLYANMFAESKRQSAELYKNHRAEIDARQNLSGSVFEDVAKILNDIEKAAPGSRARLFDAMDSSGGGNEEPAKRPRPEKKKPQQSKHEEQLEKDKKCRNSAKRNWVDTCGKGFHTNLAGKNFTPAECDIRYHEELDKCDQALK